MNWQEYSKNRPKTIFCDIDGTLVKHDSPIDSTKPNHKLKLLPGTIEKLTEWDKKCYRIILTTGRRECSRVETEKQLSEAGIIYDQLFKMKYTAHYEPQTTQTKIKKCDEK